METKINDMFFYKTEKERILPFDIKLMGLLAMIGISVTFLCKFNFIHEKHKLLMAFISSFNNWDYAFIIILIGYIVYKKKSIKSIQIARGIFIVVFFIDLHNVLLKWYNEEPKGILNNKIHDGFIPVEVSFLVIVFFVMIFINFIQILNEINKN